MTTSAPPLPVLRLLMVLLILALNTAIAACGRAAETAHIVMRPDGWLPDWELSRVKLPELSVAVMDCDLGDFKTVEEAGAFYHVNGVKRNGIKRWCLPETAATRRIHSIRLDELILHMRDEKARLGLKTLHAWDVGVARAIVLHDTTVMLNPRIKAARDRSECRVRMEGGQVAWVPYHRHLDVEYDTPSGATYLYPAKDLEACGLEQVI